MQETNEIKTSLKREYDLDPNALAFYEKELKEFEQKHQLKTKIFFEKV